MIDTIDHQSVDSKRLYGRISQSIHRDQKPRDHWANLLITVEEFI